MHMTNLKCICTSVALKVSGFFPQVPFIQHHSPFLKDYGHYSPSLLCQQKGLLLPSLLFKLGEISLIGDTVR